MKRLPPFSLAGLVAAGMLISTPVLAAGADADGQVDQSQLDQSLSTSMQLMDTDGDGQISQGEFEEATGGAIAFSDFDTNGDGVIDQQEMSEGVMAHYGQEGSQSLTHDEFARFEQDFQLGHQATTETYELESGTDQSAAGLGTGEDDLSTTGEFDTSAEYDTTTGDLGATGTDLTGTTTGMGGELAGYTADELMGVDVIGADGETVGEVSDLVLDRNNMITEVIIDTGGFLGIGGTSYALPASELEATRVGEGDIAITTRYVSADLDQLTEYQGIEGDDYRLHSTDRAGTVYDDDVYVVD